MSASPLMSIGMSAMTANYAALQTTGNNIANANVAGYSRQQVLLQTAQGQFTGAGFFGKGVDVASVTRAHDAFLTREAVTAGSQAAGDQARLDQLRRLEQIFPTGQQGLGYLSGQLLNSMVDLASQPQDPSTRQVVLSNAQSVAAGFAAAGSQLDSLQSGITQDLKSGVASVNQLTQQIASVNERIARTAGSGQPPNDLLDQRDQLISQLGSFVQVTTLPASDGSLSVFMASGQRLVLGNQATTLAVVPDNYDISRQAIAVVDNGVARALPAQLVGAGSLGGLLSFQNSDLAAARNQLGQMATALAGSINQQQALGLDLRTPPGSGAPLFSTGTALALPAQTNAKNGAGNFVSSVSMTVADATQVQASEYTLRTDPANAGQYLLTRSSDGLVRSIASGATVDGLTINVGAPPPAASDSFLLQPVTRAANNMQAVLDDPKGIAAASPLEAVRGVANTGTATVGSLAITSAAVNPQNTATITFTDDSGDYTWSLNDRTTNALVASGTGAWQAGTPIALNGFALQLSGVPANGDQFSVGLTTQPASNNGNALALAALGTQAMVDGQTITDAYASTVAAIGVRVQGAASAADISAGVAANAEAARSSQAGVNLDEEAARLMQFQQSYQAAAKVLQTAQTVLDTLMQMGHSA
jgi:flagellar hook-associated protein 1 FlgK